MTIHTLKKFTDENIKSLDEFVKQQYEARGIDRFSDEIAAADANIANLIPSILIVPDHIKISRQKQDLPLKPGPAPRPRVYPLPALEIKPEDCMPERPLERIKKRPAKRRRGRPSFDELQRRELEQKNLQASRVDKEPPQKDAEVLSPMIGEERPPICQVSTAVIFSYSPNCDRGIVFVIALEQLIRDFHELGITTIARGLHYVSNRVGDGTILKAEG